MNIAVVLAGGIGSRVGGDTPKQYLNICGNQIIAYVINALTRNRNTDKIIVAADRKYHQDIVDRYGVEVCDGGATRNITVRSAIDYILEQKYLCDNIIFVDSARPMLNDNMLDGGLKMISDYVGVITCQKITDSLAYNQVLINREEYCLIQTPEIFRFSELINFDKHSKCTAIFQQVNGRVGRHFIEDINLKITYQSDLFVAEKLLKE